MAQRRKQKLTSEDTGNKNGNNLNHHQYHPIEIVNLPSINTSNNANHETIEGEDMEVMSYMSKNPHSNQDTLGINPSSHQQMLYSNEDNHYERSVYPDVNKNHQIEKVLCERNNISDDASDKINDNENMKKSNIKRQFSNSSNKKRHVSKKEKKCPNSVAERVFSNDEVSFSGDVRKTYTRKKPQLDSYMILDSNSNESLQKRKENVVSNDLSSRVSTRNHKNTESSIVENVVLRRSLRNVMKMIAFDEKNQNETKNMNISNKTNKRKRSVSIVKSRRKNSNLYPQSHESKMIKLFRPAQSHKKTDENNGSKQAPMTEEHFVPDPKKLSNNYFNLSKEKSESLDNEESLYQLRSTRTTSDHPNTRISSFKTKKESLQSEEPLSRKRSSRTVTSSRNSIDLSESKSEEWSNLRRSKKIIISSNKHIESFKDKTESCRRRYRKTAAASSNNVSKTKSENYGCEVSKYAGRSSVPSTVSFNSLGSSIDGNSEVSLFEGRLQQRPSARVASALAKSRITHIALEESDKLREAAKKRSKKVNDESTRKSLSPIGKPSRTKVKRRRLR